MNVNPLKFLLILMMLICLVVPSHTFAAYKTYSITPNSKTYNGNLMKFNTYNPYTKQYYLIRSYLEQLEKMGGGTLILNKGIYTISNTLYVPSNVTIRLKSGTKLVKGRYTGSSKMDPSKTIFQFVKPSIAFKKGVRSKYNGEKNISIIGEGTATIDLGYDYEAIAIVCGHNQNLKIENIQFHNMNSGHFLEVDASQKVLISNNQFIDSKKSPNGNKEAINLDTPDHATKGWNNNWSTYDKTPNKYVTIKSNIFKNLDRAIGTHKYSEGMYHDHILIQNNKIEKTRQDAIRVMNWSNATIENNSIKDVAGGSGTYRGILASGAINPIFRSNLIVNTARPIQFMPWKNSGPGSQYKITYNSNIDIEALKTNRVQNAVESFIRINHVFNVFDKNTDKVYLKAM